MQKGLNFLDWGMYGWGYPLVYSKFFGLKILVFVKDTPRYLMLQVICNIINKTSGSLLPKERIIFSFYKVIKILKNFKGNPKNFFFFLLFSTAIYFYTIAYEKKITHIIVLMLRTQ